MIEIRRSYIEIKMVLHCRESSFGAYSGETLTFVLVQNSKYLLRI
jgi:hypothetical protein